MVGELGYRIKADGAADTIQKLKQLHEEVRSGTMTTKEYTRQHRELTLAGRASSQQFNDIKGAIAAANPNLMELNKTMSIFGGTANVAMSALNTINLALISGSSAAQSLSQQYQKNADDYNAFIRLYESPQYGPGSPVTEAAYQKYQADLNTTSNLQKQLGAASIDTGISVTLSAISMIGSMSQTYTALKAIQWGNVFSAISAGASSALEAVTWFAGAVVLPLAIAVAVFEGAYYLIRALNPKYAQSMDELSGIIQKNWNVSGIEAALVAPFVGAYLGFASLEDQWREDLINFANSIINILNTIPNAINSLKIPGISIGTIGNINPYPSGYNSFYNQAIKDLNINAGGSTGTGIGPNTPYSQYTSNNPIPNADLAGAQTVQQIQQSLESLQDPTKQTAANTTNSISALAGIGAGIQQNNQSLTMINSGVAGLLQPLIDQKAAATQMSTELKTQIAQLQQTIADNINLPQTQLVAHHFDPDTGAPIYDTIALTDAGQTVQTAQQQLASLQSTVSGLDNYTSGLAPVLNSIGLSGETGIGSIISGALGGAAGVGGAGISAGELQYFANTGDYGVFTAAAIRDNTVNTPTQQDQINAWLSAVNGKGMGTFTAADAEKALGYSSGSSGSGSYDPTGAFGGLPGQYGNPGGVNINVNNNISGSLLSQQDLNTTISNTVKNSLLGVGWG